MTSALQGLRYFPSSSVIVGETRLPNGFKCLGLNLGHLAPTEPQPDSEEQEVLTRGRRTIKQQSSLVGEEGLPAPSREESNDSKWVFSKSRMPALFPACSFLGETLADAETELSSPSSVNRGKEKIKMITHV